MKSKILWIGMAVALVVGLGLGKWLFGGKAPGHDHDSRAGESPAAAQVWTCSMHPQIQQPEPGDCPICGMDLIPLASDAGDDLGPRELKLSATARKLAQIQVQPAELLVVEREINMVGTVTYDETRLATITAWVGGRLDRLYADYTGIPVQEGDHMVWMYSPDILAAQEELLQAKRAEEKMESNPSDLILKSARATLDATRDKLRLWGLTKEQIQAIEERGTPSDHIQINAPIGGIVVHKNAQEGEYVQTGTPIYRIADLNQVWVQLDAYESDLSWLRFGQEVSFVPEAYPGQRFTGRIAFIDPILTEKTRTVKVRVNVPNEHGKLKPGMFVRAIVRSQLAADGKVVDEDLAGKWISPMHPEVIRDEPGDCPVCGMPLKKAEDLGYVSIDDTATAVPLVIPDSAPLITGKRAVVYVQDPDDPSRFSGKEIVLGPRASGYYLVESGLEPGDLVVTHGNFKIDSALQIQAKPSMMSPPDVVNVGDQPVPERIDVSPQFALELKPLFDLYLQAQRALAGDDAEAAKTAAKGLVRRLPDVDMSLLEGDPHDAWMTLGQDIEKAATAVVEADDIGWARGKFDRLSAAMIETAKRFGTGYEQELLVMHCPMAFDDAGADWLQLVPEIANPYFGAAMFGCGEITERIPPLDKSGTGTVRGFADLPNAFNQQFGRVFDAYLNIHEALSQDQHQATVRAARDFIEQVEAVDMGALPEEPHLAWMKVQPELKKTAELVAGGEDLSTSRKGFAQLSESLAEAVKRFGEGLDRPVLRLTCPMAFNNRGAMWLQSGSEVANPYFGSAMYRCGEVTDTLIEGER